MAIQSYRWEASKEEEDDTRLKKKNRMWERQGHKSGGKRLTGPDTDKEDRRIF